MFRRPTIAIKILLLTVTVAFSAILLLSLVADYVVRGAIKRDAFDKLTAVREMKAQQIEDYFAQIRNQVLTFSEDRMIIDAMREMKTAFKQIEAESDDRALTEYYQEEFLPRLEQRDAIDTFWPQDVSSRMLQDLYIASNPHATGEKHHLDMANDGSRYGELHGLYHPIIRDYLQKFGYYDIFLVDVDSGHIVYSVFKEVDFATSLLNGPYANTNFADVYRAAQGADNEDFVQLADFAPYPPSYNDQASFIASPIYDGDEKIGVLIFQMPVDRINDIMTNKQAWSDVGLGKSGETYIVGDDRTLRSQSRFLIEDRQNYLATISRLGTPPETVDRIEKHNNSIALQEVDTYGTKTALAGESGTAIFPDYREVDVLSSFRRLNLDDLHWVVMSEIDKDEAFEVLDDVRDKMIVLGLVIVTLTVCLSYGLSSSLTKPLRKLEESAASLTAGNLDEPIERSTQDEIGDLAVDFDHMRIALRDTIAEIERKNDELEERVEERTLALKRQKDRMEEELNIGREIQQSLLPLIFPAFPEYDEFKVWGTLRPARELGGDFYDFYFVDRDRFCFCIGDVSGKGVPSALFMAVAKTFVKMTASDEFSTAKILSSVNQELSRGNTSAMFVTLFIGILDIKTGKLVYSNGGHNPPYLLRASNERIRLDERHGAAVGALPGLSYKETTMMLSPGDVLFLYTDGVTEALDRDGKFFTEARLAELLQGERKNLIEAVLSKVDDFARGAEQADDITVLSVEFYGPKEGMDHVLALSMRNRVSEMNDVQERFASFASQHAISESDTQRIGMVLDELLSNVISYGYTDELEHTIEIKFELTDELVITIEDDGIPFNPFTIEPPDTSLPLEDRPIGGVGIHLVRSVMDRFHYERRGKRNIVTLRKKAGERPA